MTTNNRNTHPHLLLFRVAELQKDCHIYDSIAERIAKEVPSAWRVSQNAFLIPSNVEFNEAEMTFSGLLPKGAQYLNLQICPPVFAHCDSETQKYLSRLQLDPYCTQSESN
ncbi:MAG TPA: hypothetical protein VMB80_09035 [Candidatus Acidoferrum sp.]|nr:hypothetical protein [Candidatus Acidoferrum sp.]